MVAPEAYNRTKSILGTCTRLFTIFLFFVRGDKGPFYALERADGPLLLSDLNATDLDAINKYALPITYQGYALL